jgi:hypothetical protein
MNEYVVMANRSAASRLGEAHSPCKQNGKVIIFKSREGAASYANNLNQNCESDNVYYTVAPYHFAETI